MLKAFFVENIGKNPVSKINREQKPIKKLEIKEGTPNELNRKWKNFEMKNVNKSPIRK